VKRVGDLTFEICKNSLSDCISVDEGKICDTILQLYNKDAIVLEPEELYLFRLWNNIEIRLKVKCGLHRQWKQQ
jgi:deoxycytidine triphosphate deaminase